MSVIVDKASFKKLAEIVGIREAALVAKEQGISLAVVQLWIRS